MAEVVVVDNGAPRASKVIKEEIRVTSLDVARLTSLLKRLEALKVSYNKEQGELKGKIEELEKIIKDTGGTRAQIILLSTYRKKSDELPELLKNNEQNIKDSSINLESSKNSLEGLNKELNESLLYEESLKLRLLVTVVDSSSEVNSLLVLSDSVLIPAGTSMEVLSYDGTNYVKVGSISEPIDVIKFGSVDYNKILIDSRFMHVVPGVKSDSGTPAEVLYATYHKLVLNFDISLSVNSPFILFDSQFYHSDGSIWVKTKSLAAAA